MLYEVFIHCGFVHRADGGSVVIGHQCRSFGKSFITVRRLLMGVLVERVVVCKVAVCADFFSCLVVD